MCGPAKQAPQQVTKAELAVRLTRAYEELASAAVSVRNAAAEFAEAEARSQAVGFHGCSYNVLRSELRDAQNALHYAQQSVIDAEIAFDIVGG